MGGLQKLIEWLNEQYEMNVLAVTPSITPTEVFVTVTSLILVYAFLLYLKTIELDVKSAYAKRLMSYGYSENKAIEKAGLSESEMSRPFWRAW